LSGQSSLLADRYRIERELGRGGMAVVYLAHDTRHDRKVAIKFIGEDFSSAVGGQRFLQEIKLTAALQHPHVLPVYDSGVTSENVLYYVMPYIEGGSLRDRLATGPLPIADVVKVARGAADALTFAHQRGIVHRDIKPENILFSDGHALVADFGIARMVTSTKAEQLTAVGVIVGTPAYMSPEQGFGGETDHRSDIYSLACVVYEMLTGKVPFNSPAAGQWTQFGLSRMPPSIRAERAEVPEALESELIRALAPSPGDRHASAREFADALQGAAGTVATPYIPKLGGPATRARRAWRSGLLAGAALAAVTLAALAFFPPAHDQLVTRGVIALDASHVLLAPVLATDTTLAASARLADRALRQELRSWSGLSLVTSNATRDALGEAVTQARALRAGRQLRAGTLLWARLVNESGAPHVEAQVFDSRSGTNHGTITTAIPATDSAWAAWARLISARLLAGGDAPAIVERTAGATRSLPAWQAYVRGQRALDEWRLTDAAAELSQAVAADPRFAAARAWLAQALVWTRRPDADWRRHAEESLMLAGALNSDDRAVAQAIAAIGRRDLPRACAEYGALVARDSMNARAWLGLGDCHALDKEVLPDPRSSSGWRFRGNYTAAINAYERAVRLSPRAHAALPLSHIQDLILTQVDRARRGQLAGDSTRAFAARPTASGDSVVYIPQPLVNNTLPADPPGLEEALHRNRLRLLDYVAAWTQRAPGDQDAHEALAVVQESRGELTGIAAGGRLSALAALDTALRLASDAESRTRLAASRVRILLKAGEFERARSVADSTLANAGTSAREAHWLAGLAALTGRTREAARLARLGGAPPVGGWDTLPAPVGQAATLLYVQAAAGVCSDDFRNSFDRIDALIGSYTSPADRGAVRLALTARPRRLAAPCLGTEQLRALSPRTIWDRMQNRLASGDDRGVRLLFDSLTQARRFRKPGNVAMDFTFVEAWLLASIGDTAAAATHLDVTLRGLPALSRNALWELGQSAAVPRAMAYRATLALALGETQNASRWATAAATLWKNADAELQTDVARLLKMGR
jgi:tetratricopeptide (TPR) repeat protein/tRNA A-37 threonylcarbamoyl transferase component Bud32